VKAAFEEASASTGLVPGLKWPHVLEELREIAEERALKPATLCYLDWLHAQHFLFEANDCREANRLATKALERWGEGQSSSTWLALLAMDIERAGDGWSAAREHLLFAERALAVAWEPELARAWLEGRAAELWLDLGMCDLARPLVEAESERARATGNAPMLEAALGHELKLLTSELDFEALDALEEDLQDEPWFQALRPAGKDRMRLRFAVAWLVRERRDLAPPGEAARRLDELLERGSLEPLERLWALRHRVLCAVDGGDWERAETLCSELESALASSGSGCATEGAHDRLGSTRIALAARIAAERSRGRADRVELLRPHLEAVETEWRAFLQKWAGAPVRGGGLAYLGLSDQHHVLEALIDLGLVVHGEGAGAERALEHVLEAEGMSTLARRMEVPVLSLAEARRALTDERSGALVYLPMRDHTYAFALDARGTRLFVLEPASRIEDPIAALAAAAQRAVREGGGLEDPELRAAAAEAARGLLPPELEAHLTGWKRLLLVGLDDLGYVPFELLPSAEGGTQGTRRALAYAPSLPLAVELRRRAAAAPPLPERARFLLAPEVERALAPDLPSLQLDEGASRALATTLVLEPRVLAGREARAERLEAAAGEEDALLFVLAHGLRNTRRERPAGLLLAGDSGGEAEVWCEEIEALRAPPLVVLIACGAGRAPLRRGDGGRSDLAAAFLMGGALTVVLPTTDFELAAGLSASRELLARLAAGADPAEALRQTREALVARGDPTVALHAHLLHAVGIGAAPSWPARAPEATQAALPTSASAGGRWLLGVLVALLVVAVLLMRARRRTGGARS
jgi:CHAT domain-containing protein